MTMYRINVHTVQRLAQDFTRLSAVVHALSASEAAPDVLSVYRKDLDDALSDLADAMGYDLLRVEPRRASPAHSNSKEQVA